MGEPGSHDMVSKGLLFQDEEERMVSHERQCGRPSLSQYRNPLLPSVFSEVPYGPCNSCLCLPSAGIKGVLHHHPAIVFHCLINLILSLSHCVVISADFLYVSYFLPFPLTNGIQEAIHLQKLTWNKTQLIQDFSVPAFIVPLFQFSCLSPLLALHVGPVSKV